MKIAVFASGNGSNFQALLDFAGHGKAAYQVGLLVCDRIGARVIDRAKEAGIPFFVFNPKEYSGKDAYEEAILQKLRKEGIEWIVLAGYMRLVGPVLLHAYEDRIINLHPSLLPAFPGKDAIRQAYEYGVKITGVTVHFVDEGLDTGPVIAQEPLAVSEAETLESLEEKVHRMEHRLLPEIVNLLVQGYVRKEGRKVQIVPPSTNLASERM